MPTRRTAQEMNELFADRLREELKNRNWEVSDLQLRTGFKPNRISNWLMGKHIPHPSQLMVLSEVLGRPIDWLLAADNTSYQDVIATVGEATKFLAARDELITNTNQKLWLQVRSGNSLQTQGGMRHLEQVMQAQKIGVRMLICSPDDYATTAMLAMRRDTAPMKQDSIKANIEEMIMEMNKKATKAGVQGKLEILTIPYMPSAISMISDPDSDNGAALILMFNFKAPTADAPMMLIKKAKHAEMFRFIVDDFNRSWDYAAELRSGGNE